MARVLIACEFSGTVRRAFRAAGHDAWSCDILPAEDGDPHHLQEDALKVAFTQQWDLMICHPPCTHLTRTGARWWPQKQQEQNAALLFVWELLSAPIARIALENPPGKIGTAIRPADQYVHPWQFGHPEKKMTGLWLRNLPLLAPTKVVLEEMKALPLAQQNRIHRMPGGPNQWKERSRTYEGIAQAMVQQWGPLL